MIAVICSGHDILSQPLTFAENEQCHRHYWYYRTRFINDFIKLGPAQGDGICFPERNYNGQFSSEAKVGPDQIDITNQYLSTLALEYKLLSRARQSTAETVKEIYYLLRTLNRLDARADCFWSVNVPETDDLSNYPETANLNGFMLREDMPRKYFDPNIPSSNYKHFNYAITEYNTTATSANLSYTGLPEIDRLSNDNKFSNLEDFPNPGLKPQPKKDLSCVYDKYLSMYIAFMFLVKYIPDGTGYYENGVLQSFQDGETDLLQEVRNIAGRCYPYLQGHYSNILGNTVEDWTLRYPNGIRLPIGSRALPYSYALAKMRCFISSGYPFSQPCDHYQDLLSFTTGRTFYNVLPFNPIPSITPTLGSEDGAVFIGNAMAGSNAPVFTPLNIYSPAYLAMANNSTLNHVEWTDLLRSVLHQDGRLMWPEAAYANPISYAPCEGPYNFLNGNDPGSDWRSQDRLEHPKSMPNNNPPPGNYPGVDYMLLHNLYYEYLNQKSDAGGTELGAYKTAYNLMDNYDEQVWPKQTRSHWSGSAQNQDVLIGVDTNVSQIVNPPGPGTVLVSKQPAYIKVFQNLESRAQIYAAASPAAPDNTIPSKVEYRAGKSITLLDGFEVKPGADFFAYIRRYVCAESDYGPSMRQGHPQSNDYLSDRMNEQTPIHFVESPPSASDQFPLGPAEWKPAGENEAVMLVLPNPSKGLFSIRIEEADETETYSLSVYDMKGELIYSLSHISPQQDINLEHAGDGLYLIHVSSGKGREMVQKITIVH